jgi:hypothetical protein
MLGLLNNVFWRLRTAQCTHCRNLTLLKGFEVKRTRLSTRYAGWATLVAAICCINTIACGAGRSLPDTARILPPETMAFINIPDVNSLQKQAQNTAIYKLYKDPAMAAFVNSFKSKWQKTLLESSDEMSKILTDVNAVPSGRLAVAFILNEKSKQTGEPVFLVISQWGNDIKTIKTAADKAVKKSLENGARQEKETVRGRQIITITQKEMSPTKEEMLEMKSGGNATIKPQPHRFVGIAVEEENEDGGLAVKEESDAAEMPAAVAGTPDSISYCIFDDVLIASEDKEALKFMISRIDGGAGQSLADNDNYQKTMAAVGPIHDIDFYLNVEAIVKNIVAQDTAGQMGMQIATFGLDNVSSLGAAVSVGRSGGTPFAIKGLLRVNGLKKGIMKLIEPQSAPVQTPRFIDASSVSVNVCNISIKNAYDELLKIMSGVSPGFAAAMNAPLVPADEKGQGGVELKKDILDYLGSGIVVASSIKKPFVSGSDPAKTITAIAITNRAALEKSLATVHNTMGGGKSDTKRELFGHTLYLLDGSVFPFLMGQEKQPMAAPSQPTPQAPAPKLAFTVTDTHLILGSEENVTQALRLLSNKDAGSLATASWFVRAKSVIPGAVGMAGLSDSRTYGEYLWWNLKEMGTTKSVANAFDPTQMAVSGLGQFFDFSLLPNFEMVKKYFGVSTQYVISRPDGYYFESRHLDLSAE